MSSALDGGAILSRDVAALLPHRYVALAHAPADLVGKGRLTAAGRNGAIKCFHAAIKHDRVSSVNTLVLKTRRQMGNMNPPPLPSFADRLRYAREQAGFETQESLAAAVGLSQSTVGNWESGARQKPRQLLRLASVLGVSAVWLEFWTGSMRPDNPALRADVADLAALIQSKLTPEQVEKLRDMVLSLGSR